MIDTIRTLAMLHLHIIRCVEYNDEKYHISYNKNVEKLIEFLNGIISARGAEKREGSDHV